MAEESREIPISTHCNLFCSRTNRRFPSDCRNRVYGPHTQDCDDSHVSERNSIKPSEKNVIPDYVHKWDKNNPPYISSPNLLVEYGSACNVDKSEELPFRDRSLSTGDKCTQGHDLHGRNATYAADNKHGCVYKTHVLWHGKTRKNYSCICKLFFYLPFSYGVMWSVEYGLKDVKPIETRISYINHCHRGSW